MTRTMRNVLLAVIAAAGAGCTDAPSEQVLTGRVGTSGALAVRAVTTDSVVTAAQVRSDGTFTLALPTGKRYRLEVLTTSGVRHVLANGAGSLSDLTFEVCQPTDPFDVGGIGWGMGVGGGTPTCDPMTDPNCEYPVPPPPCDPADPNCSMPPPCDPSGTNCPPPPPPCDPMTDPDCSYPPPPPMCDPSDPSCVPPPPPPCMDPSDPYCACDAAGNCPPPTCDPTNGGTMDPNAPSMCPPPPPPPCADPMDPSTCDDPCVNDPMSCGCSATDPNCWPQPEPPMCDPNGTMCDPSGGGMAPEHPPGDFGCMEQP